MKQNKLYIFSVAPRIAFALLVVFLAISFNLLSTDSYSSQFYELSSCENVIENFENEEKSFDEISKINYSSSNVNVGYYISKLAFPDNKNQDGLLNSEIILPPPERQTFIY